MKPDELIKRYVGYLNQKDYISMYAMLDDQSQMKLTQDYFISRNRNIYEGIEADDIKLSITSMEDTLKADMTVGYTMSMNTLAGELSFDNVATFHKVKKRGYCLEWNDGIIFPNLTVTDKVKVTKWKAKRGSIFDRNGAMLAGQGTALSVGFVPGKMSENPQQDIEKLAELLGVSAQTIQKKLEAKWIKEDSLVPIKAIEKLDPLELTYYEPNQESLANEKLYNDLLKIPGVMITDVEVRTYPLKDKASHLTGYVRDITAEELQQHKGEGYSSNSVIGKSGLEILYEDELRGKDGYEVLIVTSEGTAKETLALKTKQDGADIEITIDAKLQAALYDEFAEDKSCSVAMNPKTGEVLALVSTPSFNANDFVLGLSDTKWTTFNEDEKKPLWNRFRATWCPGSSFKSVVAAIGVTTHTLDPNEDFGNVGRSWQKDKSWGSYYVTTLHDYNNVIMENALIYSDNIYFAKAALKMGADTLTQQLNNIGFGERVPFDIWMSESQYANTSQIKTEIQLADTGYGQGQLLINPLHLASIYTAFINNGNMVMPILRYQKEKEPVYWKEKVFTQEAVKLVKDALIQVIESPNGLAKVCHMDSVTLAGKTGTAEIKASKADTDGTELGWFAVFTPDTEVSDALLLISMVEDVKERGGSTYVVKKDKKILDQIYN